MRTTRQTESLELVDLADLAAVTGGCKKRAAPQAPCNCGGGSVEVEVSTGAPPPQAGSSQAPLLI